MNKTVNINLANTAFTINETAYKLLQEYLNQLSETFKKTEGKEEILDDIETRIAELFYEYKKNADYVINEQDVKNIIEILGEPKVFNEETDQEERSQMHQTYIDKKLFRDPDDKYIGGVAAGISHYFAFEPTWIRLIWLLLGLFSGGTFLLIYLIFWIIVPEAKTTSDKLRMRGKPINIATIEKKIREEFEEVSERVKNVDYQEVGGKLKKKSKDFFGFLAELIGGMVKIILKLFGLLFLFLAVIASLGWCVGFVLFFIFKTVDWPLTFHIWGHTPFLTTLVAIGFFIVGMIPLFFLFLLGNFLLSPHKSWFGRSTSITLLILWFISLLGVALYAFLEYNKYDVNTQVKMEQKFHLPTKDTLYIRPLNTIVSKTTQWEKRGQQFFKDSLGKTWVEGDKIKLILKESTEKENIIEIIKKATGTDFEQALENANALQYEYNQNQNALHFSEEWFVDPLKKAYGQKLEIILWIKPQQTLQISSQVIKYLPWKTTNNQDFQRNEMAGHFWKMEKGVLQCLDCDIIKKESL